MTLALLFALHGPPAPPSRPWFASASHYGKWVTLAAGGGMLAEGAFRHRDADRAYQTVVDRCQATPPVCNKAASGEYQNAEMEGLYQQSVSLDRRARTWLVGGEVSLLAAGTMFLVDLIYRDNGPRNIPFTPFTVYTQTDRIGLSLGLTGWKRWKGSKGLKSPNPSNPFDRSNSYNPSKEPEDNHG
jgi:hypothetical protein